MNLRFKPRSTTKPVCMYSLLSLPGSSRKGEIMPNKHKLLSSFLSGTVPERNAVKKGLYGERGEKMVEEEKRGDEMKKNSYLSEYLCPDAIGSNG